MDVRNDANFAYYLLTKGLRIGVLLKRDEPPNNPWAPFEKESDADKTASPDKTEIVEYHFILRRVDDAEIIKCVMYKSLTDDPLRYFGTNVSIIEFRNILSTKISKNYTTYYSCVSVKVYPYDWYPCFEKDMQGRMKIVSIRLRELESSYGKEEIDIEPPEEPQPPNRFANTQKELTKLIQRLGPDFKNRT
jgi:hypothetical protein